MQYVASPDNPFPLKAKYFLNHFTKMMGPYGLYQHATLQKPLLSEGYCTDDNARAVQMLACLLPILSLKDQTTGQKLLLNCWKFLQESQIKPGYFHNFRRSNGEWIIPGQSEDMYARLIRAFVEVLNNQSLAELHESALGLLMPILLRSSEMRAPRFWAECLVSLDSSPKEVPSDLVYSLIQQGHNRLVQLWEANSSPDWPWFEEKMTYANALLPHGLFASIKSHKNKNTFAQDALEKSASFLIKTTIIKDIFVPIGSNGWYPKGGKPSHDNQQAIEAGTMFDFLLTYSESTNFKMDPKVVVAPYLWFFGRNTAKVNLADPSTGACLDGLFTNGPNPNYGAESMLAYQWSEILLRTSKNNLPPLLL